MKALVPSSHTFFHNRNARSSGRKRTTGQFGGIDSERERQGKGETSTCLMAIGDITYTNNEAEDDNIFCMMSVFVKAVLTQRDGTLNHPHALDVHMQRHTHTHTQMHPKQARPREDFTSHFLAWCHVKYAIARGEEETRGHFVWEVYASFVSQHRHTHTHTNILTHRHYISPFFPDLYAPFLFFSRKLPTTILFVRRWANGQRKQLGWMKKKVNSEVCGSWFLFLALCEFILHIGLNAQRNCVNMQ